MNIDTYKNHCCGCGECAAVCPNNAIRMDTNKMGFFYPVIDKSRCINCSKCVNHCSFNRNEKSVSPQNYYAYRCKKDEIRSNSRSGGIFTALSDLVFKMGGVVYGCKMITPSRAVHIRATTLEERDECRGSKYIQSEIYNCFESVKRDLQEGYWVLFSGTACQVNAVKDYCSKKDHSKLILVDIICFGVPGIRVWRDYINNLEKQYNSNVVSVDFRDKSKFGWADHKETVCFSSGAVYSGNTYARLFNSRLILRKDCFACPYKNLNRVGDITIGDCWGIAENYPEFDDNKGVSLVIINTAKGKELFDKVPSDEIIEVSINKVLQPALKENWPIPAKYEQFWKDYSKMGYLRTVQKYLSHKENALDRGKRLINRCLRKVYRTIARRG